MPKKATPKELSEIVTGHQAQLQKIASNWAAGINKEISATDSELIRYIQEQLKNFGTVGLDKKTEGRFMQMEKDIRAIRQKGYDDAYTYVAEQTGTLASNEAKWAGAYTTALTGEAVKKITQDAINNLAKFGSYNGHTIQEWFTNIADKEVFNILGVARNGLANGESLSTMVGRIMGTPGIKGILDTSRVEATALARTACNGVANDAKMIFYEQNQDVIQELEFVATLDFRTSEYCATHSGERYKVPEELDKVPSLPAHINCRSVILPVTALSGGGTRPAANADFDRIAKETYEEKYPGKSFSDLTASTRDKYYYQAQKDFEKDTGKPAYSQVSNKTSFSEWFANQSAADQKSWLGATKYELYKKGDMPLTKFVNPETDKAFTIAQLKERDKAAFAKIK